MKLDKLVVAVALVILGAFVSAHATGGHYVVPVVVKPPVVVAPPVVVTPPPAPVAPIPPPAAPAQQSVASGNGPGALGYGVMAGVSIYFGAVIWAHWVWCAEDDKKSAKERKCYRPLRDGMPK